MREQADRLHLVAVRRVAERVRDLGVDDERVDRLAVGRHGRPRVREPAGVRPEVVDVRPGRASVVRASACVDDPERIDRTVVVVVVGAEVDAGIDVRDRLAHEVVVAVGVGTVVVVEVAVVGEVDARGRAARRRPRRCRRTAGCRTRSRRSSRRDRQAPMLRRRTCSSCIWAGVNVHAWSVKSTMMNSRSVSFPAHAGRCRERRRPERRRAFRGPRCVECLARRTQLLLLRLLAALATSFDGCSRPFAPRSAYFHFLSFSSRTTV